MSATWWIVLSQSGDRVVYTTESGLEAFRVARRRSGGSMRMRRSESFGVMVVGRHRTLTVIRVASPDGDGRHRPAPERRPIPVETAREGISVDQVVREGRDRVAIPVGSDLGPEIIALPGGGSFTWLPAESIRTASATSR